MILVYVSILFYANTCGGSLEKTRQTTLGAMLVDSHASVAMYFLLKNPTRNITKLKKVKCLRVAL